MLGALKALSELLQGLVDASRVMEHLKAPLSAYVALTGVLHFYFVPLDLWNKKLLPSTPPQYTPAAAHHLVCEGWEASTHAKHYFERSLPA